MKRKDKGVVGRAALIDKYAEIAHPHLMRYMKPKRHCIAATWVTLAVLRNLRVQAEPLAMKLRVVNARLVDAMQRASAGQAIDWKHEQTLGAWEIQIGYNEPEEVDADGWNGHLVAFVPSRGLMIDASLSQCSRPAKRIELPPVGVFATGRTMPEVGKGYTYEAQDGVVVRYEAIGNTDWQGMTDWTRAAGRYRQCAVEIMRELTRSK